MKKIVLLLAIIFTTSATAQVWKEKDKQVHFFAGMTVGGIAHEWNKGHRDGKNAFLVTMGTTVVAAFGKELYDEYKYKGFDMVDALSTIGGGLITYGLSEHLGINGGVVGMAGLTGMFISYNF